VGGVGFSLIALVIASLVVRVPYYTLSPGSVWSTDGLIEVEGGEAYFDDAGEIAFTTVSIKPASAFEAALGWADPDVKVVDEEMILGGRSEEENRQVNEQAMSSSQETATVVALQELGYEVVSGTGAEVVQIEEGRPADGTFEVGDVIVGVEGVPVTLWEEVVSAVGQHRPGDRVNFSVERGGEGPAEDVTVDVGSYSPEQPDRPIVGIVGTTRDLAVDLPFEVVIDAADVGGPSAGLAFTLSVLDILTPGDLTGGSTVAATGTMAFDGSVGPIGGIEQKTVAAREAGVDLFLVPLAELDEARAGAGSMQVVGVGHLDDALAALDDVGGNALALGTPGQESAASTPGG
jgi:PDZ domain-containing protein